MIPAGLFHTSPRISFLYMSYALVNEITEKEPLAPRWLHTHRTNKKQPCAPASPPQSTTPYYPAKRGDHGGAWRGRSSVFVRQDGAVEHNTRHQSSRGLTSYHTAGRLLQPPSLMLGPIRPSGIVVGPQPLCCILLGSRSRSTVMQPLSGSDWGSCPSRGQACERCWKRKQRVSPPLFLHKIPFIVHAVHLIPSRRALDENTHGLTSCCM